ncbi:MAG TPA: type II toxin-antitoxin system prevent-host-death family antitoxin [Solirubrobacterales bacterium]|nr:type II toxin-antitoxin system prevent-host-death family antitoxin [Solirubrobacterales bacterium]
MNDRVGVGELRQNLSKYLRRVEKGERILVTDRNKPVAELGPPLSSLSHVDRLIAEGKVKPPRRPRKPGQPFRKPAQPFGGVDHEGRVTRALLALREGR